MQRYASLAKARLVTIVARHIRQVRTLSKRNSPIRTTFIRQAANSLLVLFQDVEQKGHKAILERQFFLRCLSGIVPNIDLSIEASKPLPSKKRKRSEP